MTFNFKKAALALAASAIFMGCMSFGGISAYADEEEGVAVSETDDTFETSEEKDSEDGQWTYVVVTDKSSDKKTVSLEKYKGDDTEITFPEEIDGTPVTALGEYTFYENMDIKKVTIPKNITDIGRSTFFGCTSLTEYAADDDSESFKSEDGCLMSKDGEKFLGLPAGLKKTEFTVPDGVRALGPSAFAVCKELKKINLPDTLELIDFYCFAECESLNNVVLPSKVTSLGMFAFTGCTSLTDITFSDSLTEIGGGAFFSCTSLKEVTLPDSLTTIGQCAFVSTGFDEIELPVSVQDIGYSAFGFTTDEQGQLKPMDKFTLKGVENSYAHQYAADADNSHISFVKVAAASGDDTESSGDNGDSKQDKNDDNSSKTDFKKIAVLGGAALGGIAVIAGIAFLIRKLTGKGASKNSEREIEESDLPEIEPLESENDSTEENDQ